MFRPGGGKLMPGVEIMCDYRNLFLETGAPELYLLHRWEEESCQTNPSSPPDWCCGRP